MKILVIGCGSIGQRHLKNLIFIKAGNIFAFDINKEKLKQAENISPQVKVSADLGGLWQEGFQAAFICTPTTLHVKYALAAAKRGCHLFIEKPLSDKRTRSLDRLMKVIRDKRLTAFIGYSYRFNDCMIKIKELLADKCIGKIINGRTHVGSYLPARHPWEDYRLGYGARKSLGGGVIMDALSHHIDYLIFLFGRPTKIFCHSGKRSTLDIDVEDTAEILLKFPDGLTACLHGDSIQRPHKHTLELIGEKGTILCDFVKGILKYYDVRKQRWILFQGRRDHNLFYMREIKYFLGCIKRHALGRPDIRDGKEELDILLKAQRSNRAGKWIKV